MKKIVFLFLSATILLTSCTKSTSEVIEAPGQTTFKFDAHVGSADFALKTDFVISGRTYNFDKLRYWVSNVSLVDTRGNEYKVPNSYFLVEETSAVTVQDGAYTYPAKKREDVSIQGIPAGEYTTIKLSIGVDSIYNNNLSLQSGELSQLSGMTNVSWMWHTSYIFASITGTIKDGATSKTIKAETGLNKNFKSLTLTLPSAVRISSTKSAAIGLTLDLAKVLNGLDLITTPTIGAGQAAVMSQLATNYTQAITVTSVQ